MLLFIAKVVNISNAASKFGNLRKSWDGLGSRSRIIGDGNYFAKQNGGVLHPLYIDLLLISM